MAFKKEEEPFLQAFLYMYNKKLALKIQLSSIVCAFRRFRNFRLTVNATIKLYHASICCYFYTKLQKLIDKAIYIYILKG